MSASLASALEYAARGWFVLPLDPVSGAPVSPRHDADHCDRSDPWCRCGHAGWEHRATVDLDRVVRTWERGPWAVGIACGPSMLVVLDTATGDPVAGEGTLLKLARSHGALPATWTVSAPNGGLHRYYSHPTALASGMLGPHLRVVGTGGYVPTPLSRTGEDAYLTLVQRPVAPLPSWIVQMLTRSC